MQNSTFLNIFMVSVLSCLLPSVVTLKCYQCESATNKNCTYKLGLYLNTKSQECTENGTLSLNGFTPNCLKILTTNYYGRIVEHQVVRQCIWTHENQNPCAMQDTLRPYVGFRTAHQECAICSDRDGCNSASSMKMVTELVVLGTLLSTVALFAQ